MSFSLSSPSMHPGRLFFIEDVGHLVFLLSAFQQSSLKIISVMVMNLVQLIVIACTMQLLVVMWSCKTKKSRGGIPEVSKYLAQRNPGESWSRFVLVHYRVSRYEMQDFHSVSQLWTCTAFFLRNTAAYATMPMQFSQRSPFICSGAGAVV